MARLKPLFHYAILGSLRASSFKKSGATKILEVCLVCVLIYAFYREVIVVLTGAPLARIAAGRLIILVLSAFCILLPAGVFPSVPADSLAAYPLSRVQAATYRVISQWLDWKVAPLFAASLIGIAALLWTPNPLMEMMRGIAALLFACLCGTALALWTSSLRKNSRASAHSMKLRKMHRFPLLHKELAYFGRTFNPYLCLLIAAAAGYSEIISSWMTGAEVVAPLLIIFSLLLGLVLNPFALSSESELHRYRIMPATFSRILGTKHLAIIVILVLSASPLLAAVFYRQSSKGSAIAIAEVPLFLISLLLTGMLLMHTHSARRIRIKFWSPSSNPAAIGLIFTALVLNAASPLLSVFLTREVRRFEFRVGIISAEFGVLLLVYVILLRRQRWESSNDA
jgi:hypothetical protein